MRIHPRAGWVAAPAALIVGLFSCTHRSAPPRPVDADYVVRIGIGEPRHLVPSMATGPNAANVLSALFTPLVRYDAAHRPVAAAAESITTEDSRVWTVRLRPGWTFHNGEEVTADAYLNAWNAGAYGPNAHDGNYFFDRIQGYAELNPADATATPTATKLSGLTRVDDLTFRVTLVEPYVNFRSMLGHPAFLPLPAAAFADVANNRIAQRFGEAPIGQGPFRMKGGWQHDRSIATERFDGYAGADRPRIGGVTFRIYQRTATQYQDLRAGTLDIVPQVPLEYIASARAELGDRFRQSPASTFQMLAFPTHHAKYSKVEIRRAVSMAIDREQIVRTIFGGSEQAAYSFVAPVVPGYRANTCGAACRFDPVAARALFRAVNGPAVTGGRIEISYNTDGGHKPWVDAVCQQLKTNLGVACAGSPHARFAELLARISRNQPVGAFRMGWVFDYPAMENYLGPLYSTNGASNYHGYSNAEFDRLLAAGDRSTDPEAATVLYQRAEDLLARDLPVLPLRFGRNNFAYAAHLRDVGMDLLNRVDLVRIQAARQ